jgi:SAM-dependent methyltransferase
MDALERYREVWNSKPVLRTIYQDFFDRIAAACVPGHTLEIGAGISHLSDRLPDVIASDIQFSPTLDLVTDAQQLPFPDSFLANIVMLDVLHHIEFPLLFLRRAATCLRHGGRIIMIEPAITWGSSLFYRLLHPEPVDMSADPLSMGEPDPRRDPYDANQAIPTLIATRQRARFHALVPELQVVIVEWFSFAAYPMSGGFKRWSLLPNKWTERLLALEHKFENRFGSTFGFRMMLVIEKTESRA